MKSEAEKNQGEFAHNFGIMTPHCYLSYILFDIFKRIAQGIRWQMHLEKKVFLQRVKKRQTSEVPAHQIQRAIKYLKGGKITRKPRSPNLHVSVLSGPTTAFSCGIANPERQDT